MPNEIFSIDLSPGAILVYAYLVRCEDRKTYQCYPSYSTIGNAVGMSKNTVRKYVTELEKRQLIYTEKTQIRTHSGRKRNGNLMYTILPFGEALERYYEQKLARLEFEAQKAKIQNQLGIQ